MKPVIFGCSGTVLTACERDFFRSVAPFGFIVFKRNCDTPDQIRKLVHDLRDSVGYDAPVFIDQEGGRVARLKPPHWPELPALRTIGKIYEKDKQLGEEAISLHSRITAHMLRDLGINGNCSPVSDLLIDGASTVIGDRAFSDKTETITALAKIVIDTFLGCDIFPVIKHLPGHGRVIVDPHLTLPIVETEMAVLEAEDFAPFIALKDAPIGMNCHVIFKAIDPTTPVSLSKKAHEEIIRGKIGFGGLIFSDDLTMKALRGGYDELANTALSAGADIVLHCSGELSEMQQLISFVHDMRPESLARWERAKSMLGDEKSSFDSNSAQKRLFATVDWIKNT